MPTHHAISTIALAGLLFSSVSLALASPDVPTTHTPPHHPRASTKDSPHQSRLLLIQADSDQPPATRPRPQAEQPITPPPPDLERQRPKDELDREFEQLDREFKSLRERLDAFDYRMRDLGLVPNQFGHPYFYYPLHFNRFFYDPGQRRFYLRPPRRFLDPDYYYFYHPKFRGQIPYPYYNDPYYDPYYFGPSHRRPHPFPDRYRDWRDRYDRFRDRYHRFRDRYDRYDRFRDRAYRNWENQ